MLYLTLVNIQIQSEDAMKAFGERIGRSLVGGEHIQLVGDIGAGKTTLTKGIAKGLDITETVQSPTFTINRVYDGRDGINLSHYDFYRLSEPGVMADELAETSQDTNTVIITEWGESVADLLGNDNLEITFTSPAETEREIVLAAKGESSEALLGRIKIEEAPNAIAA